MARHRAPDVDSTMSDVHLTGAGRPRHAAGLTADSAPAAAPRAGRHRGAPSTAEQQLGQLEFIGPIVVVEPQRLPLVVARPAEVVPQTATEAPPEPAVAQASESSYAEIVAWAGFAALVSCGVVAAGQGPREPAIWTLGICGVALSVAGLALVAVGRRRRRHAQ